MARPRYPALFQVNTRVRLSELGATLGRRATLDDLPDSGIDALAERGFDIVWFLGIWQTGEAARHVSATNQDWLAEDRRVLADFRPEDAVSSRDYHVHADFGGDEALAGHQSQCRVGLPWSELAGRQWRLEDALSDELYERDGSDLGLSGSIP